MRPTRLSDYVSQSHLVGEAGALRLQIEKGITPSLIFWGPPGTGKTTLAYIIAKECQRAFFSLSAISSGIKEVREIIEKSKRERGLFTAHNPIIFIDEIHRFSKSQQDSLLAAVETGDVTLIGATTENPSFEVIRPLLSRCQVYVLEPLTDEDLLSLLHHAIEDDLVLREREFEVRETDALLRFAGGDARKLLNIVDLLTNATPEGPIVIDNAGVTERLQQNPMAYDKEGEMHYDIISAFIKSIRGSDPDAAIYWLARMIAGGEDPKFIARRLVISAAEDIGLANPNALLLANAAFDAVNKIGWPEGRIPLSEATIYLATSPKSNSAYNAINAALAYVEQTGNAPVPLHLRNAPTKLMKSLNYGADYHYPHDYPEHFVAQQYKPQGHESAVFWYPADNAQEMKSAERMQRLWGGAKA